MTDAMTAETTEVETIDATIATAPGAVTNEGETTTETETQSAVDGGRCGVFFLQIAVFQNPS